MKPNITNPSRWKSGMHVLVMTSVSVEKEAVLCGLHSNRRFDVLMSGVSPVAAANTASSFA